MIGDAYTFICLERSTKLIMAWHLGKRDRVKTEDFVSKIRRATAPGRFDVSTDGLQPYETAIDAGLYDRANHAAVVKMFSTVTQVVPESYRPAKFVSVGKDAISGNPDLDSAGTSNVERKNGRYVSGASGSRDLRMRTRNRGKICELHWHCISPTITCVGFTARWRLRQRWQRGSRITFELGELIASD
jgi:hypothetical protein